MSWTIQTMPVPAGLGVGWMAQRLPSHRSASVDGFPPETAKPAAVQSSRSGHDTAHRKVEVRGGLGTN